MNAELITVFFTAFAALVSIAMWVDYFRRIDVFEKEGILPLLIALMVGGCTPFLSLHFYHLMDATALRENGHLLNDLFYAVFVIGLNEETCKLIGVAIVFLLLRKQINEPIDYLVYAGVTALGFSMVENFNYFSNHGVRIITSRTFYSALEHIINTSIIVYGVYRRTLFKKGDPLVNTLVAFVIAVSSHALFDFFLKEGVAGYFTAFLSMLIYLVGINFWVQMLNNANNYSNFFDYDKVPFTARLVYRLLAWYGFTLVIAFANNWMAGGLTFSLITLAASVFSDGFLFFIVILRVSRFKILQNNYLKVRLGFPFYFTKNKDQDFTVPILNLPVKIRGENSREHHLTRFLNREVEIHSVDTSGQEFLKEEKVLVEKKHLLHDDVVVYSIAFTSRSDLKDRRFVLKSRMGPLRELHHRYPVHGLFELRKDDTLKFREVDFKDLDFVQWVYLKTEG